MMTFIIIQTVLCLTAFFIGVRFFCINKSSLYFRLLFYGVASYLLKVLFSLVECLCSGGLTEGFSFATFGASACFAFMLSANYGQFDSFVDDGSNDCKKARILAFLAPAVLSVIYVLSGIHYLKNTGNNVCVILTVICKLPAFFAAYYHFKHLILPDIVHFVVDSLRPCNALCLALIFTDIISDAFFAYGNIMAHSVCDTIVAALMIFMVITAERGHKAWKI